MKTRTRVKFKMSLCKYGLLAYLTRNSFHPCKEPTMDDSTVMVTIVLWIVLLEYVLVRALSNFAARKLCHAGCGLGIMLLDSNSAAARYFVWSVASSSIMMTWKPSPLPAFRFSRPGDVGITIYLLLVSAWFYAELSPLILAPVFFADPAGAVVGKWCSRNLAAYNPVCYGSKTVLGSLAVFAVTWLTITYSCSPAARLLIAAAACVAEAVGGEYDNLALAAVVLVGWRATAA